VICTKVVRKLSGCFIKGIASLLILQILKSRTRDEQISSWLMTAMPMGAGARSSFQLTSFSVETLLPRSALAATIQYLKKKETEIKIGYTAAVEYLFNILNKRPVTLIFL
jgi:hypothetical protein